MKKTIFIIGLVVAVVAFWLLRPLFVSRTVHEAEISVATVPQGVATGTTATTEPEGTTMRQGSFVNADGFHRASGKVKLTQVNGRSIVRFDNDFQVTNGPDLFVIFGKNGKYDGTARLSALRGNIGSQNYEVPASLNPDDYNEIWIWCRAFNVPFGHAELR